MTAMKYIVLPGAMWFLTMVRYKKGVPVYFPSFCLAIKYSSGIPSFHCHLVVNGIVLYAFVKSQT